MKIILFDLDGTLIDSTQGILQSFYEAFSKNNLAIPSDEKICSLIGYPLDIMFKNLGVDENLIQKCLDSYKAHYREISLKCTKMLPNAVEAISFASTFATLGVVTTKTGLCSKQILEHFDVLKYFEVVIGREDVNFPKPHQEPILTALKHLHVDKNAKIFMVGDTILDINCAKNAHVSSVGVLCGYGDKNVLKQHADITCKDSFEAVKVIQNIK